MKTIVSIAGARPQFIKAFITIKSIKRITKYKNMLIHTGQHFDYRMSKIFFNELKYKKDLIEIKLKKKTSRIPRISEMINKDLLYQMQESAFIINISRGEILDQKILIDLLKKNKIRGAALDVFNKEPLNRNSELFKLDNP